MPDFGIFLVAVLFLFGLLLFIGLIALFLIKARLSDIFHELRGILRELESKTP